MIVNVLRVKALAIASRLRRPLLLAAIAALVIASRPQAAAAQRPDSARVVEVATVSNMDTLRSPLTPRRAFLYSLILPGFAQSKLGRHKAAALILLFEGVAISMIRESATSVREARATANDSLVVKWEVPTGGGFETPTKILARFDDGYVRSRRSHLEDWIAILVANHLFAGADAYVAAHLWDVPARLSMQSTPNGLVVAARIAF